MSFNAAKELPDFSTSATADSSVVIALCSARRIGVRRLCIEQMSTQSVFFFHVEYVYSLPKGEKSPDMQMSKLIILRRYQNH